MDTIRAGLAVRALRRRRRWRQCDLAIAAQTSQDTISRLERGLLDGMTLQTVTAVCKAVGARATLEIRWRGAALDRLLDERHAALAGTTGRLLERLGWTVEFEVSFSHFGERGSIDVLGWHGNSRMLLVVEVKSEIGSVEETVRRLDVKARLARTIAAERFPHRPYGVGRLLVIANSRTARRQVKRHGPVLDSAFPNRGRDMRDWLREPSGTVKGLLFVSSNDQARLSHKTGTPQRVRAPRSTGSSPIEPGN